MGKFALCQVKGCSSTIKLGEKSSTSGLIRHLKTHKIELKKLLPLTLSVASPTTHSIPSSSSKSVSSSFSFGESVGFQSDKTKQTQFSQGSIASYLKCSTLEETIAQLAAQDGLTIHQIAKSKYIRRSLQRDFPKLNIPKSSNGTMRIIFKYYKKCKEEVIALVKTLKCNGKKFSLTLDEWTSRRSRRYINVNIPFSDGNLKKSSTKVINLGMIRINGSCSAERMLDLVYF